MKHAAALDLVQRTPTLDDLSHTDWDVVVVGAGPAGAAAAIGLAQLGRRVLLVEAKAFPRDKVCGGCLNARAWNQLQQLGVDQALLQAGAARLDKMRLITGRHSAAWQLPEMTACSRRLLDARFGATHDTRDVDDYCLIGLILRIVDRGHRNRTARLTRGDHHLRAGDRVVAGRGVTADGQVHRDVN